MGKSDASTRLPFAVASFVAGFCSVLGVSSGYALLRLKKSSRFPLYYYCVSKDLRRAAQNYADLTGNKGRRHG